MDTNNLTPEQLIHKLSVAGRYPNPDLINAIFERRSETEPLLLSLFSESFDDDWPSDNDPRWHRFTHAGAFMIAWQNLDALSIFARLYMDDDKQDWLEAYEEDLYYYGPAAIPYLQQVVGKDSGGKWHYGRGLSGSTLQRIAAYYPETREEIAAIFRALLPLPDAISSDHDEMWGNWAAELGELSDEASRDHILALDDIGIFSPEFFMRQNYLRDMNRGFKTQKPPQPYDIRDDYQKLYEWEQENHKRIAREREQQQASRIRPAQQRSEPKVGRNDPCPCGSGKKYKKCHGRPGAS